jgi:hypothetical protein
VYQLLQLGYTEIELKDPLYADEVRQIPDGGHILNMDASKALRGDGFRFFPTGSATSVELEGVPQVALWHYLDIFQNCEDFGLPGGGGWGQEQPWLLPFLSRLKTTKRQVEIHFTR